MIKPMSTFKVILKMLYIPKCENVTTIPLGVGVAFLIISRVILSRIVQIIFCQKAE